MKHPKNNLFSSVLIQGCRAEKLPEQVRTAFDKAGFLRFDTVNVTGLVRLAGMPGLIVILPKGYENRPVKSSSPIKNGEYLEQAILTIRVINRCLRNTNFKSRYIDSELFIPSDSFNESGLSDALEAAFMLRRDFLENGYYWQKSYRRKIDAWAHPVNWKRSLDKFPPELEDSEVSFRHTVHSARMREPSDFLHRMHATVVNDIFCMFGDDRGLSEGRSLGQQEYDLLIQNPKAVLMPLLNNTFRERGRRIIQLILAWLDAGLLFNTKPSSTPEITGFCFNYSCVWEHMLRELLDNAGSQQRNLEYGQWRCAGERIEMLDQRPPAMDLRRIMRTGKKEEMFDCIIDAKDKKIKHGERSGSAGDHYKQIMYTQLTEVDRRGRLFNVLLFPEISVSTTFRLLGQHRWKSLPTSEVYEAAADLEAVSKAWLHHRSKEICSEFSVLAEEVYLAEN